MKNQNDVFKSWSEHINILEAVRKCIEDVGVSIPVTGAGRRLRESLNKAWDKVTDSIDTLDTLITSSVQPLPVDFPWRDKEFTAHWQLYKDYLQEQHNITMRSRMEQARLKHICDFSKNDRVTAIRSIDYYMAIGTASIFPVNFENTNKSEVKADESITIKLAN